MRLPLLLWIMGVVILVGCVQVPTATIDSGPSALRDAPATNGATQLPTSTATIPLPTLTPSTIPTEQPTVAPSATVASTRVAFIDSNVLHHQSPAPTAAPTARADETAPSDPVRLVISAIELDRSLVPVGLDANMVPIVPDHDIGWYSYSARPGQGENVVFWGHVLGFRHAPDIPAPFANLHKVAVGTPIVVYTADGVAHEYVVREQIWATPDEVSYILPKGQEQLTLVSCIGDKVIINGSVDMSHRLITIAEPVL